MKPRVEAKAAQKADVAMDQSCPAHVFCPISKRLLLRRWMHSLISDHYVMPPPQYLLKTLDEHPQKVPPLLKPSDLLINGTMNIICTRSSTLFEGLKQVHCLKG
ncbi:hypothetical protein CEUSTIGMA_g442.t1 [Chlamydomonas eustigma]|uniref:Uncharacterized protein n=1 Tax=Chlamydomonas eustigma TaxID=1157962 RepID=A0A250WR08_9CHLO|nr:hypothetical protein CEUSTIGMA_g442.t1 [Chlamydomonas eustigma]|eukprot:GAX72990.1 hypothetical protein CEUSTIGMA_g442.t1 [Chlamydomonas eustigma]